MKVPGAALVAELLLDGTLGYFEDAGGSGHVTQEEGVLHEETTNPSTLAAEATDTNVVSVNATLVNEEQSSLESMLMVLVPLVLLALLLLSVILFVTYYRRKRSKQEPSTEGSQNGLQTYELGSEHLKVPIFEEDTPSVMEIEMEELDKWMNSMNKNDDCGCLPPLKEEKEPNHSPSDNESQT